MSRIVNINELTNIVTNASGLGSDNASLQASIKNIQTMVDYGTKTIYTNNIRKFDTSPIVVADAASFQNSIQVTGSIQVNGTTTQAGSAVAGANTEIQYNNNGAFGASANLTFDGTSLVNPSLKAPTETLHIMDISNSSIVIQTNLANKWLLLLNTDVTDITFSGLPASGVYYSLRLFIQQDSFGLRTLTWPPSIKWGFAGPPNLTLDPSLTDVIELNTLDGGNTWFGITIGLGF